MRFEALTPAALHPATETAQRFLGGAYDSVRAVLDNLELIRAVRKARTGDVRGRLPANEEDLLRAAVVFAAAGLDAALKQLIRDSLPELLATNPPAQTKFEAFADQRLRIGDSADPSQLARYLTAQVPRDRLIEDYIYQLTGSSLQSVEEVQRTAGALGINDPALRKRIDRLKPVFVARNEISHELDLQRPERQGDRARRTRAMQPIADLCREALDACQHIINAAVRLLTP